MKKSRFSPAQIAGILKSFDQGKSVEEITREHGVSRQTFYQWRKKYGGMDVKELRRMKELEEETSTNVSLSASINILIHMGVKPPELGGQIFRNLHFSLTYTYFACRSIL